MAKAGALTAAKISTEVRVVANAFLTLLNPNLLSSLPYDGMYVG